MATADRISATRFGRNGHEPMKYLIGPELRARTLSGRQGKAATAVSVLNRMTRTAKPVSRRVA